MMDAIVNELYEITCLINIIVETLDLNDSAMAKHLYDENMDEYMYLRSCKEKVSIDLENLYKKQEKIYKELLITVL